MLSSYVLSTRTTVEHDPPSGDIGPSLPTGDLGEPGASLPTGDAGLLVGDAAPLPVGDPGPPPLPTGEPLLERGEPGALP